MSTVDYSSVTEKDGDWVTQEALSMVYTRYRFALDFCRGKRLLEVACGQAVGLGYLAKHAAQAVGADVTEKLLNRARHTLQETLPLLRLDADSLPLRTASRDVIVCYEAIYYLKHPIQFLQECRRVLSPQGFLLLCTVNPEWPDFNPSPYSRQYYSARQLSALLEEVRLSDANLRRFSCRGLVVSSLVCVMDQACRRGLAADSILNARESDCSSVSFLGDWSASRQPSMME